MSTLLAADDAAQTITRAPSRPSANARANPRTKADDRAIPFYVENLSALAKSLREQLTPREVEILALLARALAQQESHDARVGGAEGCGMRRAQLTGRARPRRRCCCPRRREHPA